MFSAGHPEVWSHLRISTCPPRTAESWISIHFAPLTRFKKKESLFKNWRVSLNHYERGGMFFAQTSDGSALVVSA